MMGLFFRYARPNDFLLTNGAAGEVPLYGPQFTFYVNGNDSVRVGTIRDKYGSGFIAKGTSVSGPLSYSRAMGIAIHEFGHYLFSNIHSTSGIMTSNGGISVNDLFMSGYEKYKLGLLDTLTVNYSNSSVYSLGDISGRNGSTQLLRVPISSSEFFIIENRRKISNWDVYMLGDSSKNEPFRPTGEYGKGLYIYHSNNSNLNYAGNVDVECADGLWNWSIIGTTTPDWSNSQSVSIKRRTSIPSPLNNDPGGLNSFYNADGISAGPYFSIGKRHTSIGLTGTDRFYTNEQDYWTSREIWGDRYDAWNIGYNQVFSPYSNPNTKTVDNAESGIFIYYETLNNGIANLKIYKAGVGFTESEILAVTPPSRPMGIVMSEYYIPNSPYCNPKILWNHNSEPDMVKSGNVKRYKIYKATRSNMNSVPTNGYSLMAILDIPSTSSPEYIDNSVYKYDCSLNDGIPSGTPFPIRYYVVAVDKFEYESVPSDFVQAIGIQRGIEEIIGADNIVVNVEVPKEYSLNQNYPNPFNPVTKIKYDIPLNGNVSIKIYDINGRLINTLINEYKTAGRYEIDFNGKNLSSGVYYYKIESGNFSQVRKMILIN